MDECPKLMCASKVRTRDVAITGDEFTIGRGVENHLVIDKHTSGLAVSRVHCKIYKNEEIKWIIEDLSKNGTFLDGSLIGSGSKLQLKSGSRISLNEDYSFIFKLPQPNQTDSTKNLPVQPQPQQEKQDSKKEPEEEKRGVKRAAPETSEAVFKVPEVPSKRTVEEESSSSSTSSSKASVNERMHEELQCSICTELFVKAVTLNCSHTFCSYCIAEWRKKRKECPICRKQITSVAETLVLDNVIANVVEFRGEEEREERKQLLEQREKLMSKEKISPKTKAEEGRRNAALAVVVDLTIETQEGTDDDDDDEDDDENDDEDDDEDSEYEDYDFEGNVNEFFSMFRPRARRSYQGYGYCFRCGDPTHWAPDCPMTHGN